MKAFKTLGIGCISALLLVGCSGEGSDETTTSTTVVEQTTAPPLTAASVTTATSVVEQTTAPPPTAASVTAATAPVVPAHEVKVDKCVKEGIEVIASGTLKNLGTEAHSFVVTVEFYDKGGAKIEEGNDFLSSIEPGQTARWRQDNFTEADYTLGDCKVVSVS